MQARSQVQDDLLSEVLTPMRLRGVFHSRWTFDAPWGLHGDREDNAILHYIGRGTAVVEFSDDTSLRLREGDLALFPHGTPHRIADRPGRATVPLHDLLPDRTPGAGLTLRHPPGAEAEAGDASGPATTTTMLCGGLHYDRAAGGPLYRGLPRVLVLDRESVETEPFLAATLQRLLAEGDHGMDGAGAPLIALRAFELVFVLALRAALRDQSVPVLRGMRDPAIGRALLAMHARPAEPWTLQTLAAEAGLSRSAFASAFRELIGQTPMRHLAERRMQEAARLLRDTGLPQAQVAERVGYRSTVGFHLAFRTWSGGTPGEFRTSLR
jgi:AraC-like DNA-binding protein